MRSFYFVGCLLLLGCGRLSCSAEFASLDSVTVDAGGEGSEGGADMIGISGRRMFSHGGMSVLGSAGTGSKTSSLDAGEGGVATVSSGGASSLQAGEGGMENSSAGVGGDSEQGAAGETNHVPTCEEAGVMIRVTAGGMGIAHLCQTSGDLSEVRNTENCGTVDDLDDDPVVFLGCVYNALPESGTRVCFDAWLTTGGYACDRVGQEYCGNLMQYQATVGGMNAELFPGLYPLGCATENMCRQAVCFAVP